MEKGRNVRKRRIVSVSAVRVEGPHRSWNEVYAVDQFGDCWWMIDVFGKWSKIRDLPQDEEE